jgi:hypothetical protein
MSDWAIADADNYGEGYYSGVLGAMPTARPETRLRPKPKVRVKCAQKAVLIPRQAITAEPKAKSSFKIPLKATTRDGIVLLAMAVGFVVVASR